MIAESQAIAGSQTIAEVCFHMIADDLRTFCDLRSAIVCDHMETSLKAERKVHKNTGLWLIPEGLPPYLGYTGRAAEKGMVFRPRCPKQSAEF